MPKVPVPGQSVTCYIVSLGAKWGPRDREKQEDPVEIHRNHQLYNRGLDPV